MKKLFTLVGLVVLALNTSAQVQRSPRTDVIDAVYDNNAVPTSVNYTMPYAVGENRYMAVIFMGEFSGNSLPNLTGVSYGGVAGTQVGTSIGTGDRIVTIVYTIKGDDLDAAAIAAGSSNPLNLTWSQRPGGSYLVSVVSFRYVSQVAPGNNCLIVNNGNSISTLSCGPVTTTPGDLLFHFSQFSRDQISNIITLDSPGTRPVNTNAFLGAPLLNALKPINNVRGGSRQFVATTWSGTVPVGVTSYTPTFNNASGSNPSRWNVNAARVAYQAVFQQVSGNVWFDGDGDKMKDPAEAYAANHFVVAVHTNGPNTGKVALGGVGDIDANGNYTMNVQANQVDVGGGTFANPTFKISIVASNPGEGANFAPNNTQGDMGTPGAGFNNYYVTNPQGGGGAAGPFSTVGQFDITAVAPFVPLTNRNAGMQSPPVTDAVSTGIPVKPAGTFWELDNPDQLLSGADFEDGGVLSTGKNFRILSNPTPGGAIIKLAYDKDGDGISMGDIIDASADPDDNTFYDITNYQPSRMFVYYETSGNYIGSFNYTAVDAAGATSPTPTLYDFPALLPLSGLELNGTYNNAKAYLRWKVQQTGDIDRFVLERSTNGVNFMQVATIGNGRTDNNFNDDLASYTGGDVYYRVKVVRKNGAISFSNIVNLKLEGIRGLQLAPTVVRTDLQVRFNNPKTRDIAIRVVNVAGQVAMTTRTTLGAGNVSINLSGFEKLSNGTYTVQVFSGTSVQQGKIMVQH